MTHTGPRSDVVKEHINGLVALSNHVTESVSLQALVGSLLRQRGLDILFADLEHVDRFIRKTAGRLICDLAYQSKPNSELIVQQNGFSFNGVRLVVSGCWVNACTRQRDAQPPVCCVSL